MLNEDVLRLLVKPTELYSRADTLTKPCPVPQKPGIYAWYFKEIPPRVPVEGCVTWHGLTMLYVGISPAWEGSSQNLYERIRKHYMKTARVSTLRKSLGCLLSDQLGIRLQQVGNISKASFADGEAILSEWMAQNAFVTWVVQEKPWKIEEAIIHRLNLPLNLQANESHPFHPILSSIRKRCLEVAKRT